MAAECPPERRQRAATCGVDDHVPAPRPVREVLAGVVAHVVRADRADQIDLRGTAHPGDLGTERLRDLHRERADPTCRADHQHTLSGLHLPDVSDRLESREARDRERRGLLEAEAGGLRDQLVPSGDRELCEGAFGDAHHLVAGLEARDRPADGLDGPRDVPAPHAAPDLAEPGHQAHEIRQSRHQVPHVRAAARGVHPDEHLVLSDHGICDVAELQYVGGAEPVLDDALHRVLPPLRPPRPWERPGPCPASLAVAVYAVH